MIRFLKEIGKAFFVGTLIFLVLKIIEFLNGQPIETGQNLLINFGYNQLYSVVLYMVNVPLFTYFTKKYKGELYQIKNLIKSFFGAIASTVCALLLLQLFVSIYIEGGTFAEFIENQQLDYYYVSFTIALVVNLIFYIVAYYKFKNENKVREQKIIAGTASAKFDALKNQLDPHFLFNSLNVLTSLIEENQEAAVGFTTALSKVYRYVLEQKNKELVTVAEELEFAKLYISLLKMRFENSISFTYPEILKNPEAKVVPLSLQLILENAVKHNQVTPSKPLNINIEENFDSLLISNNLQPKQVVSESTGVGLRNIRQRYYLLTKQTVNAKIENNNFVIAIPTLQFEPKIVVTQDGFISEKKYKQAKKKVENIKAFYIHFAIYLCMLPVFICLNFISETGFPWAIFPIFGWGFGVSAHASEAFEYNPLFGKAWEERKIKQLMEKEKQ